MTDDEIEALAKKHICPHHDRLDAILPNRFPYQQTEQFRRVKALITDVLSKMRAPVAGDKFTHNDDCARYLASAPVAAPVWNDDYKHDESLFQPKAQASAPVARDAERDYSRAHLRAVLSPDSMLVKAHREAERTASAPVGDDLVASLRSMASVAPASECEILLAAASALASAPVAGEAQHPDDAAVDRFAVAMKAKLAEKRAQGYGGWDDEECPATWLSQLLRSHVEKGDPLDVGNFAMMLHQRGERITGAAPQASEAVRDALWILTEHNALHFGEQHSTVIQGRAALSAQPGAQKYGTTSE